MLRRRGKVHCVGESFCLPPMTPECHAGFLNRFGWLRWIARERSMTRSILILTCLKASLAAGAFGVVAEGVMPAGRLDAGFDPGAGPDEMVRAVAVQPDGMILIGGNFSYVDEVTRAGLARLDESGRVDDFSVTLEGAAQVEAIQVLPDGRILVGGNFTGVNGLPIERVVRLFPDGSVDTSLNPGSGPNGVVSDLIQQDDGGVVLAGYFTSVVGLRRNYIARLEPGGLVDQDFNVGEGPNNRIKAVVPLTDGKFLIAGDFTSVDGVARNRIARLMPDGSLDPTFHPGAGANGSINTVRVLSGGSLIVGGNFGWFNGVRHPFLARLLPDGLVDMDFHVPALNWSVEDVLELPDGRILAVGLFTTAEGKAANRVVRLLADGRLDTSFQTGEGLDSSALALARDEAGRYLIGGSFQEYDGQVRPFLVRLEGTAVAPGGEIEFAALRRETTEIDSSIRVKVVRRGGMGEVEVAYESRAGTAAAVEDFESVAGTLTFAEGQEEAEIVLSLVDDAVMEGTESLFLDLISPTGDAVLGARRSLEVWIRDNDTAVNPGASYPEFATERPTDGEVYRLLPQPDGKILAGGSFGRLAGVNRNHFGRLLGDGSPDPDFNPSAYADGDVYDFALLPDERLLIGGSFNEVNGEPRARIARLFPDGRLDPSFRSGENFNGQVKALQVLPDGKILVAGSFNFLEGVRLRGIARLHPDGLPDFGFSPGEGPDNTVNALTVLPDGKILIAGNFDRVHGIARYRIARLLPDGTLDPDFDPGAGPNAGINAMLRLPDGRLVIGGHFTRVNGFLSRYVACLTSAGLVDPGFQVDCNGYVTSLAQIGGGRIYVGGRFSTFSGIPRSNVVRLFSDDGAVDMNFDPDSGPDAAPLAMAIDRDGELVAGGGFQKWDSVMSAALARVRSDFPGTVAQVEFSQRFRAVEESDLELVLEVHRTGEMNTAFTVDFEAPEGSAGPGDFGPVQGTLSFEPNVADQTIKVPILSDSAVEGNEDFQVVLRNPSSPARLGSQRAATITIIDDDHSDLAGGVDVDFSMNTGANGKVTALAVLADGDILAGGDFSVFGGVNRNRVARLLPDGTMDPGFEPSLNFNGEILTIGEQSQGMLVLGGNFNQVNDRSRYRLARLRPDGVLDPAFNAGDGFNGPVAAIHVRNDDSLVVAGGFSTFNGIAAPRLVRLRPDGSRDETFDVGVGPDNAVECVLELPDGKFLIGGAFQSYDGFSRRRIARLHSDGRLDLDFQPGEGANSSILALARQKDGKILAGGNFTSFNGVRRPYCTRLTPEGVVDMAFSVHMDNRVSSLAVQEDGMIYLAGRFTKANETPRRGIARVLPDGTVDPSFDTSEGADAEVTRVRLDLDGKLLLGGDFATLQGGQWSRMARLQTRSLLPGGQVELEFAHYEVAEDAGSLSVAAIRSGSTDQTVSVSFRAEPESADDSDFQVEQGVMEFLPGQSRLERTLNILNDNTYEGGEQFRLVLADPEPAGSLGPRTVAYVHILDDDRVERAGAMDPVFPEAGGASDEVLALERQPDGQILVGGRFAGLAGRNRNHIGRINPDGTIDAGFLPGLYTDRPVTVIRDVPDDGRILIGGEFTVVNGADRGRLARLSDTGVLDPDFFPGPGFNRTVNAMAVQADGNLLVGGEFTQLNGATIRPIVRLGPDGSLDPSFAAGTVIDGPVRAILEQPDGRVIIGGAFTQVDGELRNRIARLLPDGSLDLSFDPGEGFNSQVLVMRWDRVGRLLVAGDFNQFNAVNRPFVARLDAGGSLDDSFLAQPNLPVYALEVASDGRIVIGGIFNRIEGESLARIARLLPNGQRDISFTPPVEFNDKVNTIALEPDGDILDGGRFTTFNSVPVNRLARLQGGSGLPVPVQIMTQPAGQIVPPGAAVELSVVAFASPPVVYQWRRNGVNLPGADEPTLRLDAVQPADAGDYRVVIANEAGAVLSDVAAVGLEVNEWPFADQFDNRGTIEGSNLVGRGDNFDTGRESGEPIHAGNAGGSSVWLSWTAPDNGILRVATSGSTFDTLLAVYRGEAIADFSPLAEDDDGGGFFTSRIAANVIAGETYQLAIDGYAGSTGEIVLSLEFEATEEVVPVIESPPEDVVAPAGGTATFKIRSRGQNLAFQWFLNGLPIPGATASSIEISDVQTGDAGLYHVEVRNPSGLSTVSPPAVLEIGSAGSAATAAKFQRVFENASPAAIASANENDRFVQAGFVSVSAGSVGTQLFDNFGASTEAGEPNHGGIIGGASKWFGIVPESNGLLEVSTEGSEMPTVIAVYTGNSLRNLALVIETNGAESSEGFSHVRFPATQSTKYLVAVDTPGGIHGKIRLTWSLTRISTPPVFTLTAISPGGEVSLHLEAPAGSPIAIESSTDLLQWTTLHRETLSEDFIDFLDPSSPGAARRFYRARIE